MSKLGAKTYGRKAECKTTVQFDHLLADKANKPSTAKVSVAAVHRWGMTSFTSLRKTHLNGQKDTEGSIAEPVKRMKTEVLPPKEDDDPFGFDSGDFLESSPKPDESVPPACDPKLEAKCSKPNKFFKSGGRGLKSKMASMNTTSKNDFDSLRLSGPQNYSPFSKPNELDNVKESTRNGAQSASDIKNSRLFDSLVNLEPKKPRDHQLTEISSVACDEPLPYSTQHDLNPRQMVSYPDNLSNLSMFLDAGFMGNQKLPLAEPATLTQPDMFLNQPHVYRNVINDDRTLKISSNFDDLLNIRDERMPPSTTSSDFSSIDKIQTIDLSAEVTHQAVCDLSAASLPQTKPKLQTETICSADASSIGLTPTSSQGEESDATHSSTSGGSQQPKVRTTTRLKKIFNTAKKPKAIYNHRHWQAMKLEEEYELEKEQEPIHKPPSSSVYEDDFGSEDVIQPIRPILETKTQFAEDDTAKPTKRLYTVVRNVKQAYQCHESGETQEFNDDIEYLLEGLQGCNSIGTRCLSVLGLATKCMGPAFRIHLRAHGTMPKMFSALHDAPSDPNLALCTATLLFVLSQDRLTMDIEASTLSLMLQLLETESDTGSPEKELELILEDPALCAMQEKHREKVHQLCEQMQQKGHAKQLKLDNINTPSLAMETLLSLTSRKAGDWFKEEMRVLHGLDHIVDTITCCVDSLLDEGGALGRDGHLDKIRKIDRCLRVLENVTYTNCENQEYLLNYKDSRLSIYCLRLLKMCKSHLLENQSSVALDVSSTDTTSKKDDSPELNCLLSVLKVLLNITFENPTGCFQVGALDELMETVLLCILQVPRAIPAEKRFDLLVLSLGVMINLVEHCSENRKQMMGMYVQGSYDTVNDGYEMLAIEALVEVMLSRLDAAQQSEEQADELLSSQEVKQATNPKDNENAAVHAECLEETLMKTLQKAGKHMEHSMIAAYISFLIGCIIQNNDEYTSIIKEYVPEGKFDCMVEVLKKFMSFVTLAGTLGNTDVKSIQRIIDVLSVS